MNLIEMLQRGILPGMVSTGMNTNPMGILPGEWDYNPLGTKQGSSPQASSQSGNVLDQFLNKPGGSMLMNLLAQSGYSPMPQSPFGAIGRAALMTQQQGQARDFADVRKRLMEAQIKAMGVGQPQESFRAPTAEEIEAYNLDPTKAYRVNALTGEIEGIGSAGTTVNVDAPPPLEKGFQWERDENGRIIGQRPIKGGTVERQRQTRRFTQSIQSQTVVQDIERLNKMADEIPFGREAAIQENLAPYLQSDAYRNANALIKSVQGNVGVDQLINIKQTGAGLGQVPQSQLDLLSRLLGELSLNQSKEQFLETWNRTGKVYRQIWQQASEELEELGAIDPKIFDMELGIDPSDGWEFTPVED